MIYIDSKKRKISRNVSKLYILRNSIKSMLNEIYWSRDEQLIDKSIQNNKYKKTIEEWFLKCQ